MVAALGGVLGAGAADGLLGDRCLVGADCGLEGVEEEAGFLGVDGVVHHAIGDLEDGGAEIGEGGDCDVERLVGGAEFVGDFDAEGIAEDFG